MSVPFEIGQSNYFGCATLKFKLLPFHIRFAVILNIGSVVFLLQYLVVSSHKVFFYNSDSDHENRLAPSIILEIR